jgi:hypothetical protein
MKSIRIILAGAGLLLLGGLAYVAQRDAETSGHNMLGAASEFAGSLKDEQKKKAIFDFDSKERTNWNFVPLQDKEKNSTRKGLPLEEMTADQKKLALNLARAGTSKMGAEAAAAIMSLEAILKDQEKGGAMVRNPEWYFFTIFGTPSKTGKWGWRVEGHHLSLNFTMEGAEVVASTPTFFGANPAEVKAGPKKGLRILAPAEDLARDLFLALGDEQKKTAHQPKHFPEPGQKTVKPALGAPVGVAAADMNAAQKAILSKLLDSYTSRMPADVAAEEMNRVKDGGFDKIHFAYTGETKGGHTYRVQGPLFVVEFLNIQADSAGNPANHIHSAWRRTSGDFGIK